MIFPKQKIGVASFLVSSFFLTSSASASYTLEDKALIAVEVPSENVYVISSITTKWESIRGELRLTGQKYGVKRFVICTEQFSLEKFDYDYSGNIFDTYNCRGVGDSTNLIVKGQEYPFSPSNSSIFFYGIKSGNTINFNKHWRSKTLDINMTTIPVPSETVIRNIPKNGRIHYISKANQNLNYYIFKGGGSVFYDKFNILDKPYKSEYISKKDNWAEGLSTPKKRSSSKRKLNGGSSNQKDPLTDAEDLVREGEDLKRRGEDLERRGRRILDVFR